ncbi:hypothetical protein M422DRAFT_27410 [Sphaerobolus stellatus SS14]|nr:hypothetical protein M422DRAFT_27410 [Sphaerobolus stellatus SS14]
MQQSSRPQGGVYLSSPEMEEYFSSLSVEQKQRPPQQEFWSSDNMPPQRQQKEAGSSALHTIRRVPVSKPLIVDDPLPSIPSNPAQNRPRVQIPPSQPSMLSPRPRPPPSQLQVPFVESPTSLIEPHIPSPDQARSILKTASPTPQRPPRPPQAQRPSPPAQTAADNDLWGGVRVAAAGPPSSRRNTTPHQQLSQSQGPPPPPKSAGDNDAWVVVEAASVNAPSTRSNTISHQLSPPLLPPQPQAPAAVDDDLWGGVKAAAAPPSRKNIIKNIILQQRPSPSPQAQRPSPQPQAADSDLWSGVKAAAAAASSTLKNTISQHPLPPSQAQYTPQAQRLPPSPQPQSRLPPSPQPQSRLPPSPQPQSRLPPSPQTQSRLPPSPQAQLPLPAPSQVQPPSPQPQAQRLPAQPQAQRLPPQPQAQRPPPPLQAPAAADNDLWGGVKAAAAPSSTRKNTITQQHPPALPQQAQRQLPLPSQAQRPPPQPQAQQPHPPPQAQHAQPSQAQRPPSQPQAQHVPPPPPSQAQHAPPPQIQHHIPPPLQPQPAANNDLWGGVTAASAGSSSPRAHHKMKGVMRFLRGASKDDIEVPTSPIQTKPLPSPGKPKSPVKSTKGSPPKPVTAFPEVPNYPTQPSPRPSRLPNPHAVPKKVRWMEHVEVIPRPAVDSDPYDDDELEEMEERPPSPRRGSKIWDVGLKFDWENHVDALSPTMLSPLSALPSSLHAGHSPIGHPPQSQRLAHPPYIPS